MIEPQVLILFDMIMRIEDNYSVIDLYTLIITLDASN